MGKIKKIIISIIMITTLLSLISITGCSAESKYEKEFIKIYNDYNSKVSELNELVDYCEENPGKAPENYNDDFVIEARKMYASDMVANIEKLDAPYEYVSFDTSIWFYYIYLYNYYDGEEGLTIQEAQELLDSALSSKNPINNKVINAKRNIKEKFESNKTRKEIIKFDAEYWQITDELTGKQKVWADEVKDKGLLEWVKINEVEKKYYLEYISKFKNLAIPEPLQDFYYKKLEQCNLELEKYDNWKEALEFILSEQQNIKQEQSSLSMENVEKLAEEGNNLSLKMSTLDLECKQIIKNVYLEYNLDDLINKWQKIPETTTETEKIKVEYNIGDTGPAGGNIFYMNPNYETDGWHYLEAAPSNQSGSIQWYNGDYVETGATGTAIGAGMSNTQKIVSRQGEGNYAAKLCSDLTQEGYSDWFLPSQDELGLMYTHLYLKSTGSFEPGFYWSSSEYDAFVAWYQGFDYGSQIGNFYKDSSFLRVRAVRAFN